MMKNKYGNFVPVPYDWYKLCGKYHISEEIAKLHTKDNTVEINAIEINVLAYLANYEQCYPSNNQLAELFNVEVKTIEKYLRKLKLVGLIKTFENKNTKISRRIIYVQFDMIDKFLKEPLRTKGLCTKGKSYQTEKNTPTYVGLKPLHTLPTIPTDVTTLPYERRSNNKDKKDKKEIRKNVAAAPSFTIQTGMFLTNVNQKIDLSFFNEITKEQISKLDFSNGSNSETYDWYTDKIFTRYIQCCNQKKNATDTIKDILRYMNDYECNLHAVEIYVAYLLYQHRVLKRDLQSIAKNN